MALAGATGFTGRRVAARLAKLHGAARIRCLVRASSDVSVLPENSRMARGDLHDEASLVPWLAGCRTLVYVASMGFAHVPAVVAAAQAAGVERALFVSTTAIFTRLPASSKALRVAAEECVRGSRLRWTIVRPTMIYGAPGDRNMERLLAALVRWPVLPVPGSGEHLLQPVHVDDLATAIVAATERNTAIAQEYELSGAEALSFDDTVAVAARAVGQKGRKLHLPLAPVCWGLRVCETLGLRLPVRQEQVSRLAEDKAFGHASAAADLGFAPRTFEDGIASEAELLGLGGGPR